MLVSAARNGWKIPAEIMQTAPAMLRDIMEGDAGVREKLRAIETFVAMHKANIDALVQLDKVERLESGQDTERTAIRVVYEDEASARMGRLHNA